MADLGTLEGTGEGVALVSVLASGLPGHWLEHAWLTDRCGASASRAG